MNTILNATAYHGFDDVVGPNFTPFGVCRIMLRKDGDVLSIDNELADLGRGTPPPKRP